MAIVSAAVESNGWVLQLVVSGGAGGFGDYALAPDASPRVLLRSSHPGFVKSGGEAVSGTLARSIPATRALRLPVDPLNPTVDVLDEEDIGGGQRRVRIALSNHVYATDTSLLLDVLAGWRTGEDAATGISVTNNSTLVAPVPIMRWARLRLQVVQGAFRLSLVVMSHHPLGFEPVAGVKFTVTDGTNTKTVWATALGTDNDYGDNLRCYTVEVDPTTATALTAGLLRCDAEVYPWLGAMRTTDPAGTRSMSTILSGRGVGAERPYIVGFDPTGNRYRNQWIVIDSVNGTTTASSAMVQTTLAGARAVAAASKPRTVRTAFQALQLANKTLPAANGRSGGTRTCDGATIVLAPGVNELTGAAVTFPLNTVEIPVRVIGDPDDPNPRENCIVRTVSPNATFFATLGQFESCTIEIGSSTAISQNFILVLLDNVIVRGRAGFEGSSGGIIAAAPILGQASVDAARTRWWRSGVGMGSTTMQFGLIRKCEFSRTARAACILTSKWIGRDDDLTSNTLVAVGNYARETDLEGCEDNIIAYNDIRAHRSRSLLLTLVPTATAGTTYPSVRRMVIVGNVFEMFNRSGSQPMFAIGEGAAVSIHYNIIENNTVVGERTNAIYNDPNSGSSSINSDLFCNRIANNLWDSNPTKHDKFLDGVFGYRPWLIGGWSDDNGVMHEGNFDSGRAVVPLSAFPRSFYGLRSSQNLAAPFDPLVTDDRSGFGANTGGGDYRPASGSPVLGRVTNSNTDRDLLGVARMTSGAAGAYEQAVAALALVPDPTGHAVHSTAPGVVTGAGLMPMNARHGHFADGPALMAVASLAPAGGMLASRASTSALLLSVALTPLAAGHVVLTSSPTLEPGGAVLVPDRAVHGLGGDVALLSVPVAGVGARRLIIGPDERTAFARLG
jgi:hypothetical protein